MRICFYRHSLLSRGGDKMVAAYADNLSSRGHDVSILANQVNTLFQPKSNVKQISFLKNKGATIISAIFGKRCCDVIIADIIVLIFFLSWRNNKRIIYFAQDYDETYYKSTLLKALIRAVYHICLRIQKIPVIAVSHELGQLLKNRFHADVTVVPNGVVHNEFYPEIDNELSALKGDKKVVLVFARSDYRKGFDIAVRVLNAFRNDIDTKRLLVWAVGEDIDTYIPMMKFGFVMPDKLRKILSCADVLLYPSRHEGFGLFVLEAMACGCPVVTTDAVPFATDQYNALMGSVDDIDALSAHVRTMLSDDGTRRRIVNAGLETAGKFDVKESMDRFERVLLANYEKGC